MSPYVISGEWNQSPKWTNHIEIVLLGEQASRFPRASVEKVQGIMIWFSWLLRVFLPQIQRAFLQLWSFLPMTVWLWMPTLHSIGESLHSILVPHLGQWVGSVCAPTVITFWAKELLWSSSPWVFVIIYIVLRWAWDKELAGRYALLGERMASVSRWVVDVPLTSLALLFVSLCCAGVTNCLLLLGSQIWSRLLKVSLEALCFL